MAFSHICKKFAINKEKILVVLGDVMKVGVGHAIKVLMG